MLVQELEAQLTTERAARIARVLARLGITSYTPTTFEIRRSWARVARDRQLPDCATEAALTRLRDSFAAAGNIDRLDEWLTRDGRAPKGLRRAG